NNNNNNNNNNNSRRHNHSQDNKSDDYESGDGGGSSSRNGQMRIKNLNSNDSERGNKGPGQGNDFFFVPVIQDEKRMSWIKNARIIIIHTYILNMLYVIYVYVCFLD
ncbi:hypothetical protein RFI_03935, partial [Reticulomyxa filosa]